MGMAIIAATLFGIICLFQDRNGCAEGRSRLMPVSAFRLGFTDGLMSKRIIVWSALMLIPERKTL